MRECLYRKYGEMQGEVASGEKAGLGPDLRFGQPVPPPGFLAQECASSRKEKGSSERMGHKSAQGAENKEAEKRAPDKECANGGKKGLAPARVWKGHLANRKERVDGRKAW